MEVLSKLFNKGRRIVKEEKSIQQSIQEETGNGCLNRLFFESLLQQYACKVMYEVDEKCIQTIPLYSNDLTGLKLASVEVQR